MIKAVLFDLFETLITEWGHEKYTKRKMCDDMQVNFVEFSKLWEALEYPRYRGEFSFEESLDYFLIQMNVSIPDDVREKVIHKRYITKSECFLEQYMNSDIIPMLNSIKEKGYKVGLVSNCSSEEAIIFKESKLYQYIDVPILSYEVGVAKPDAAIYEACMGQLGIRPEECLYIGDGGSNELEGATKVGMKAFQAIWYKKKYEKDFINKNEFSSIEQPLDILNYL